MSARYPCIWRREALRWRIPKSRTVPNLCTSGIGYPLPYSFRASLFLSSPEMSDTPVYEPQIRALLGTASQFCEVVGYRINPQPGPLSAQHSGDATPCKGIPVILHGVVSPEDTNLCRMTGVTLYKVESPEAKTEIRFDNLLVRVHWIIEMIVAKQPCAMGVRIPNFQIALYLPSQAPEALNTEP